LACPEVVNLIREEKPEKLLASKGEEPADTKVPSYASVLGATMYTVIFYIVLVWIIVS